MAHILQQHRLARIVGEGKVLIATDLHGNCEDFQALRSMFVQLWARSTEKTRPVLVITGDLFHGPPDGATHWLSPGVQTYRDQSGRLFRELLALTMAYPRRVLVLLGNHDHAHIGGPRTSKFHADEAAVFEATLSATSVRRLRRFLTNRPIIATTASNVVMSHAAAPSHPISEEKLETLQMTGFEKTFPVDFMNLHAASQLLWRRSAPRQDTLTFIRSFTGYEHGLHIHGHDVVLEGYVFESANELCVSTSFGARANLKSVVILDNEERYDNESLARDRRIVQPLSSLRYS